MAMPSLSYKKNGFNREAVLANETGKVVIKGYPVVDYLWIVQPNDQTWVQWGTSRIVSSVSRCSIDNTGNVRAIGNPYNLYCQEANGNIGFFMALQITKRLLSNGELI